MFTRTKNKNSRIKNVGCKNIFFQLLDAKKKMKLQLPWAFCKPRSKKSRYIGSGALAELIFL
jgi:hypothetical protein